MAKKMNFSTVNLTDVISPIFMDNFDKRVKTSVMDQQTSGRGNPPIRDSITDSRPRGLEGTTFLLDYPSDRLVTCPWEIVKFEIFT